MVFCSFHEDTENSDQHIAVNDNNLLDNAYGVNVYMVVSSTITSHLSHKNEGIIINVLSDTCKKSTVEDVPLHGEVVELGTDETS